MAVDERLLERARNNPGGLRFEEAVALAEQLGWVERKVRGGSHHIFHHPRGHVIRNQYPQPLNLQRLKDGNAKDYQVQQMISMAIALGIVQE